MKPLTQVVVILVLFVTSLTSYGQNLIDLTYGSGAGDFELGIDLGEALPAGSTNLTGWVVDENTIDSISTGFANPSSGTRMVDLNGSLGSPGTIHTTVPTIPGEIYEVAYDIAAFIHFLSPTDPKIAQVSAGNITNTLVATGPTISETPIALNWARGQFRFTASSSNSTVAFKSLSPPDASGVLLDNVSVTRVPVVVTNTVSLVMLRTGIESLGLGHAAARPLLAEVEQAIRSLEQLSRKLDRRTDPAVAAPLQDWIDQLIGVSE